MANMSILDLLRNPAASPDAAAYLAAGPSGDTVAGTDAAAATLVNGGSPQAAAAAVPAAPSAPAPAGPGAGGDGNLGQAKVLATLGRRDQGKTPGFLDMLAAGKAPKEFSQQKGTAILQGLMAGLSGVSTAQQAAAKAGGDDLDKKFAMLTKLAEIDRGLSNDSRAASQFDRTLTNTQANQAEGHAIQREQLKSNADDRKMQREQQAANAAETVRYHDIMRDYYNKPDKAGSSGSKYDPIMAQQRIAGILKTDPNQKLLDADDEAANDITGLKKRMSPEQRAAAQAAVQSRADELKALDRAYAKKAGFVMPGEEGDDESTDDGESAGGKSTARVKPAPASTTMQRGTAIVGALGGASPQAAKTVPNAGSVPPQGPARAAPQAAPQGWDPLAEAKQAISAGADPAAVKARLQQAGIDTSSL